MYTYEVNLKWKGKRKGLLSSPVLPQNIEVATPPEFPKGMEEIWSPEHLFVASINSCLLTTFLSIAENSKLQFISFDSKSICNVDMIDGKYTITEIILQPKLVIPYSQKLERARHILEMSEKACLISSAVKTAIRLEPEIIIEYNLVPVGNSF
ncbi:MULTISPECIES: OsmC family protein [Flavobacterium]|uniref:OsmC family peroxiredoxin n=1 Tax=Flavobacterium gawalongense TaxID=2594432 RepID=A0A553BRF6_9FLAO|nr:OsmC family protein [Flavobacterium gawalongense]TRX03461.1 OsmC family peroxiredoxin [Flavobacterium gawalongense]TRX06770.1 OsmC family peroxiredoxin [Flavobacterium gawalongense]TRX10809.1 OsmC family peroxiredoxin [Flavobacterium gawalongense]TRX11531.1 OsmC family peroxiredoxin [Flavobacterium gawalongense]TRX29301.1 OsmC family peroxiredoxin [Flavobacterium gawalongense]